MKYTIYSLFLIFLFSGLWAQSPEAINYQGVARDAMGEPLTNTSISLRFSVLSGSSTGAVVYQEEHSVTTNNLGLFTLKIGQGTVSSGVFSNIDWAGSPQFLRVEMDPSGGSGPYTTLGTNEMVSVPYALHAKTVTIDAVDDADADPTNELQSLSLSNDTLRLSGTNEVVLPSDADSDPTNELQSLSVSGDTLFLSSANSVVLKDSVEDADADPTNEIQTLSISGDTLALSGANSVALPDDGDWTEAPGVLHRLNDNVGIGTDTPFTKLTVFQTSSLQEAAVTGRSFIAGTFGQLGVDGRINHLGTGLNISGLEIGVLGISAGTSVTDNFGVYGVSNNWGGHFTHTTNSADFVRLGGSSFALQVVDGNESNGKVLTSDASGNASWQDLPTGVWTDLGTDVRPTGFENVVSGGDFVASPGNGVINCGGSINPICNVIGDVSSPTQSFATGDEDLWIEDDLEVRGAAYKSGTAWTNLSDARLKEDIKPFTDGLSQVLQIEPVTFRYNEKAGMHDDKEWVGIIAQDMARIAPYMVEEMALGRVEKELPDGGVEVLNEGEKYLTYDANAMDYLLVNAIKEQQQLIQKQQALIQALEARVQQLERNNE